MKTGMKIAIAAAIVLVGLPVGCSVINGANSVATAPGRVVSKTMQTDNIISTYQGFFTRKATYDARLAQIAEHKALVDANSDPAEAGRLRIELSSMRQSCREMATSYNADAAMNNKSMFLDRDLPTTLAESACDA